MKDIKKLNKHGLPVLGEGKVRKKSMEFCKHKGCSNWGDAELDGYCQECFERNYNETPQKRNYDPKGIL